MSDTFITACIQNCAGPDMEANIAEAAKLVGAARRKGAQLICLPEFFSCLQLTGEGMEVGAFAEEHHPALPRFRGLAKDMDAWILLGSLAVRGSGNRLRNRSFLLDPTGRVVASYDKLHLFDVDLAGGERYRESDLFEAGTEAVLGPTPWGPLGLSVCYDLRFAYLYRALAQAGARFLTVPAAFTRTTGKAHWHVLVRSRAIETGSYVFAPSQYGRHGRGETYGHSLIVDPWGQVLADGGEGPGFVMAEIDPARVDEARRMIPALGHDRRFEGPLPQAAERASA